MFDSQGYRDILSKISLWLGASAAIGGGISLMWRLLDLPHATEFSSTLGASCAIILCGTALALLQRDRGKAQQRSSQLLAMLALLVALATLAFYFFWGIPHRYSHQGWMTPPVTSFVVVVVAASILCLARSSTIALAQGLVIIGLTVSSLALIGYMQGTLVLADLGTEFPMSVPAAVLLLLLALGVLLARPNAGPMLIFSSATSAGTVARRILLPLIFMPILLNFLFQEVAQLGWYAPGLEHAIFTFITMFTIAALVWWQIHTLYHSDRRRTELENKKKQAEGQYTVLLQSVTDYAIYTLDPDGHISSWNTGAEKISGYSSEDVLGKSYAILFHPETLDTGLPQQLLNTAQTEGRAVDEGWRIHKSGSRFYAHSVLNRVNDPAGHLEGFVKVTRDMTAQKLADAQRATLSSILSTVVDPMLVIDHRGTIETFNPAAERVFGYRAEEVLNCNVNMLMPSPDREQHDSYLNEYERTGIAHVIGVGREIIAQRKDGSTFPADLSVSEMVIDGHKKFTGIVRDITARKAAEEAVQRSEQRLMLALEAGKIGVWDLDMKTEEVIASGPIFDMFVLDGGTTAGFREWVLMNHPDDHAAMQEQFDQLARGQRTIFDLEHRLFTTDGTWYWMHSRATISARGSEGQPLRLHGTSSDIHQRKTAEDALRKSKLDLDIAMKGAAFHLWHFHLQENALADLDDLIDVLGYPRSPETQTPSFWLSLLHPDDLEYWGSRPLLPLPDELDEDGIELRLRDSDGNWHWMETRARALETDAHGAATIIAGTCLDITAHKRAAEELLHAAQHDPLTRLPNRTLTYAFGERVLAAAPRHKGHCAVLFIDLDRFKPINDIYGHAAGDEVLREVAQRLQKCVRSEDVVGRLGGDEFLVVLPRIQRVEEVARIAAECIATVIGPCMYGELELQVSCSIGISLYPADGKNMNSLVKHADTAMYHAKENGRNNFQFFTSMMNARAKTLLQLEGRMRRAIEREEFAIHYQPVVDTKTQTVIAAEALLRWPKENVGPEEFIPIAEASGLILPLGEWVFHEVCRQQKQWRETSLRSLTLSINVSPYQFRQKHFRTAIAQRIYDMGMTSSLLQLEITENALLQDIDEVVRTLNELRELGLSIALDDFGKGYSSLNSLKSLPLDAVKVDRGFLHELHADPMNLAITEAIINLGDSFGLEVIAEGIETEKVLRLIHSKRCHHMQGFYFSQPLPAKEFEAWCQASLTASD